MATFDIKMPKMGESVTECTITVLNVKVGDYIEEDTDLFEITSAKTGRYDPLPRSWYDRQDQLCRRRHRSCR